MLRLVTGSLLIVIVLYACRKSNDLSYSDADTEDATKLEFSFDDSSTTPEVTASEDNLCTDYLFGGSAGYYFGSTTGFEVSSGSTMNITFGTGHAKNPEVTREDFEKIIAVGSKDYGSLGAFSSYPSLRPNCVEISFTDAQNLQWSSTMIKEKQTQYGIDPLVSIVQPSADFVIDDVTLQAGDKPRYLVKGHFNCILYQVNGYAQRKVRGRFRGFVNAID